jgi:hypothetical protein
MELRDYPWSFIEGVKYKPSTGYFTNSKPMFFHVTNVRFGGTKKCQIKNFVNINGPI